MASILALSTLLILMPPSLVTENGQLVGDIIPKAWVGSNGVITAIIIAFLYHMFSVIVKKIMLV